MLMEAINQLCVITHDDIELLIHQLQGVMSEGFKTNQHSGTSSLCHDFKKLFVLSHIERTLAYPTNFEPGKFTAEVSRMLEIAYEIVIDEEDIAILQRGHFCNDTVDWPCIVARRGRCSNRTEVTMERTASTCFKATYLEIWLPFKDVSPRHAILIWLCFVLAIPALERPLLSVPNDLLP